MGYHTNDYLTLTQGIYYNFISILTHNSLIVSSIIQECRSNLIKPSIKFLFH
jgi:hypothetical protein